MNRETREERRARAKRRARIFALVAILVVAALFGVSRIIQREALDCQGCPKWSGPTREVIVLLDTSDPLKAKHEAELRRILREITSPAASGRHDALAVREGERLTLYRLDGSGIPEQPIAQLCNPGGNPVERRAIDDLTTGELITEWRWDRFIRTVETLFPDKESKAQPSSPILETIAVVTARHASSRRAEKGGKPTHLIVISDLLQNTVMLSHYRPYPKPDEIPRELGTDLSRVNVSLFRLERYKYEGFQTPEHFYWWRDWVENMEGKVVWQQAL